MRKVPEPSPQSLRLFGFFLAAALALPRLHGASGSVSVRSVVVALCVTLKMPSRNRAFSTFPLFETDVSSTTPRLVSMVEPCGMPCVASSSTKALLPGRRTSTLPLTGSTTTLS